jgi:CBS domain containing-hemolysin-like protein
MKLLIQAIIIIVITGFFAMLEAALFTVPLSRAKVLASQKKAGGDALVTVKQSMARSIFLLVVFMNVSTVLGSIILGKHASEEFGGDVGLISVLMTVGIILFGELIPKSIGDKHAETLGRWFAPLILFITKIFSPIVWCYEKMIAFLVGSHTPHVSEDDLRILSEVSHEEGEIGLFFFFKREIFCSLVSKPMTVYPRSTDRTASGSPTYPSPTTATVFFSIQYVHE